MSKHNARKRSAHRGVRFVQNFEVLPWDKFVDEMDPKHSRKIKVSRTRAHVPDN
jgi:hypothetical protein